MSLSENPLVSVIVPVYRVERYLDQCVRSILAQTYTDLEIILVDDGSPDRCGEMCEAYKKEDPRVAVIHQENGGLSVARNTGVAASHGELIGFVDSDDFIEPDMYEKLVGALQAHPQARIALAAYELCDDDGVPLPDDIQQNAANLRIDGVFSAKEMYEKLAGFRGDNFNAVWDKLYYRDVIVQNPFTPRKEHEDEYIIHRLFRDAGSVVSLADPVYHYRMRQGSLLNAGAVRVEERIASVDSYLDRTEMLMAEGYDELAGKSFFSAYVVLCLVRGVFDYRDPTVKRCFDERLAAATAVYEKYKERFPSSVRSAFPSLQRFPGMTARGFVFTTRLFGLGLVEMMKKPQMLVKRKNVGY